MNRDQFSNVPIPVDDKEIILEKHAKAINDHESSDRSKSRGNPPQSSQMLTLATKSIYTTTKIIITLEVGT